MRAVRRRLPAAPERQARDLVEPIERVELPPARGSRPRARRRTCRRRRGARSIDSRGVHDACGPKREHRRAVPRLEPRHLGDVGSSVGVVLGKTIERRREAFASSRRSAIDRPSARRRQVDQPDVAAALAQQRGGQRQRVRRLGRAEHLLALLAAALPRERDAADERRIDEQGVRVRASCHESRFLDAASARSPPVAPQARAQARPCSTAGTRETARSPRASAGAPRSARRSRPPRATASSGRRPRRG